MTGQNRRTSRAEPFFDAVACEDIEAARELSRLCPQEPYTSREYEEDFLFVRFLMDRFFLGRSACEGQALLDRYERALEGSTDTRLEVCRALAAVDCAEFDRALTLMMEEREVRFQKLREKESVAEEVLATEGYVSVEGLALVRLAVLQGMEPRGDFLFIPSVARDKVRLRYRPDSWKHLLTS